MSSLRELQQRAYRAILLEEEVRLPIAPVTSQRLAARLGVYRNNARETFRRTLAATYPVVARLVGEPCFRGLAHAYMRDFPSRSGDLGRFGGELSALLDIYYRDTAFAYLVDVARLEWAVANAETAAEAEPFDWRALQGLPQRRYAELRFVLHPSCAFVSSRYPVLSIWEANQNEQVAPVSLTRGGESVVVSRREGVVRLEGLDVATFTFARCLADDETLLDAQDAALAASAEFETSRALARLAELGVLSAWRLTDRIN